MPISYQQESACPANTHLTLRSNILIKRCQLRVSLGMFGLLIFMLPGCGGGVDYGPTGRIKGTLTMEGEPLAEGTQVVFMHPEKGYAAFGATDAQGNYEITTWNEGNMPIGTYKVMIQPAVLAGQTAEPSAEDLLDNPEKFEQMPQGNFPYKYRQTSSSGLEFAVDEGENVIDIDLSAK